MPTFPLQGLLSPGSCSLLGPHPIFSDAMDHKGFPVAPEVSPLCASCSLRLGLSCFSSALVWCPSGLWKHFPGDRELHLADDNDHLKMRPVPDTLG